MTLLALILLSVLPRDGVARDRVDVMELNSFYDEQGRLVFDQLITYDWHPCCERWHVTAWRLVKSEAQIPQRDWQRGDWFVLWLDGEVMREIRAASIRRTWLQFDPELAEREILPPCKRRGLSGEGK